MDLIIAAAFSVFAGKNDSKTRLAVYLLIMKVEQKN